MVQVQFLDSGEYLIPLENSPVAITKTISEIQDLSKRKGSFSKTLTFIGDKETNKLLGHYYNINLEDSSFDRKVITPVQILQDGQTILKGNMRLLRINKFSNNAQNDDNINYEVVVYDEVGTFFSTLQGKEVGLLDFTEFNHEYSSLNVKNSFDHNWVNGYKYLFPIALGNTYDLSDIKPGIYARQIWNKIFEDAGYSYDWSSIDDLDVRFSNLILPYTGDELKWDPEDFINFYVKADKLVSQTFNSLAPTTVNGNQLSWIFSGLTPAAFVSTYQVSAPNELVDEGDNYNNATSTYTAPVPATGSFVYRSKIKANITLNLINNIGSSFIGPLGTPTDNNTPFGWDYRVRFEARDQSNNFIGSGTVSLNEFTSTVNTPNTIPLGTTELFDGDVEFTITSPNLPEGNTIRIIAYLDPVAINGGNAQPRWYQTANPTVFSAIQNQIVINDYEVEIYPENNTVGFGAEMKLNKVLPKMKQTEFVKGILNLYNLYADVDPDTPNRIIITKRDDYYDNGETKDWTKLLVKDREQRIGFASEDSARSKILSYKEGKGIFNTQYQQAFDEVYGQYTYILDDKNLRGEDRIELPFSPTQIVRTEFGAYVMAIDGYAPKTNVKLIYDGGKFVPSTTYNIVDYYEGPGGTEPVGELGLDEITYAGHFDNPITPTFDLNFWIPQALSYSEIETFTANNMFNLHWRRTFNQVNNAKTLDAYFHLTPLEYSRVNLSDKIFIHDTYYNIIEIVDYDANNKGPTLVKLIQVDDNIALGKINRPPGGIPNPGGGPFPNVPPAEVPDLPAPVPSPGGGSGSGLPNVQAAIRDRKNINLGEGNIVQGVYNYLSPDSKDNFIAGNGNIIVGSKNNINGDSYIVDGNSRIRNRAELINSDDTSKVIGESSTVLASKNSEILADNSVILGSVNSQIDNEGLANPNTVSSIVSSINSTIDKTPSSNIIASSLSEIVSSDINDGFCNIMGSNVSSIVVGGANGNNNIIGTNEGDIIISSTSFNNSIYGSNITSIVGDGQFIYNTILGSSLSDISITGIGNSFFNSIIGTSLSEIVDSNRSTILGSSESSIIDGTGSAIIGGTNNEIDGATNTVILGGTGITATEDNTLYIPSLNVSGGIDFGPLSIIEGNLSNTNGTPLDLGFFDAVDASLTATFNINPGSPGHPTNAPAAINLGLTGSNDSLLQIIPQGLIGSSPSSTITGTVANSVILGGQFNSTTSEDVAMIGSVGGSITGLSQGSVLVGGGNTITDSLTSVVLGGTLNTLTDANSSVILGSQSSEIIGLIGGNLNAIVGGDNHTINDTNNSVIIGGSGITATQDNTVYVPNLVVVDSITPTSTADTQGVEGQITYDDDYIYVKTSAGWKRSALSTF